MSAATLIHEAQKDGLRFALTPSRTIKLTGPKEAAEKWAPRLREHKAAIVESLAALSPDTADAQQIDGYVHAPAAAMQFWRGLISRVDECDRLIHELCDLRGDTDAHRADLLAVRKRMAPVHIDSDIGYVQSEITALLPKSANAGRAATSAKLKSRDNP